MLYFMAVSGTNSQGDFTQTKNKDSSGNTVFINTYEDGHTEVITPTPGIGYSVKTYNQPEQQVTSIVPPKNNIPAASAPPEPVERVGFLAELGKEGKIKDQVYTQDSKGMITKVEGGNLTPELKGAISGGYKNPVEEAFYRSNPSERPKPIMSPKSEKSQILENKNSFTPMGSISAATKKESVAVKSAQKKYLFGGVQDVGSPDQSKFSRFKDSLVSSSAGVFTGSQVNPIYAGRARGQGGTPEALGLTIGSVAGIFGQGYGITKTFRTVKPVTSKVAQFGYKTIGKTATTFGEGILGSVVVSKGVKQASFVAGTTSAERKEVKLYMNDIRRADIEKQSYVSNQGLLANVKEGLYQGWVSPSAKNVFNQQLGSNLKQRGLEQPNINRIVNLGQRYKSSEARGELAGQLFIGKTSEKLGRKLILPKIAKIPIVERTAFNVAKKTTTGFIKAGFLEGSLGVATSQSMRSDTRKLFDLRDVKKTNVLGFIPAKTNRLTDIAIGGGFGSFTATALGVPVVGLAFAKTPKNKVLGKGIEYLGYGLDVTEKSTDIMQNIAENAEKGLVRSRVMTFTSVNNGRGGNVVDISPGKRNNAISTFINTNTNVNTQVGVPNKKSNTFVNIFSNVPINVKPGVPIPINPIVPIPINPDIPIDTNIDVPVNIGVPVNFGVPVNVPVNIVTPDYPFFPPISLPKGSGGFGVNVRLKKGYINELAYGLSLFGAANRPKRSVKKKYKTQTFKYGNKKIIIKSVIKKSKPKSSGNNYNRLLKRLF
jgi:hypothetical protein